MFSLDRIKSRRQNRNQFKRLIGFETMEARRLLAGIQISESIDRTIVNDNGRGFDSYKISLDVRPLSNVTIQLPTGHPLLEISAYDVAQPTQVVFTPDDWSPKSVFVSGRINPQVTGNVLATISHQVVTSDSNYQNANVRDVVVTVVDGDMHITLSRYDFELMEGQIDYVFLGPIFPPGYEGPSLGIEYDTTQLVVDLSGSTHTITPVNDGIVEGVHDVPINYIPSGPLPPGLSVPNPIVRVTDPITPEYVGFEINGGQSQRSILNSIRLFFSDQVFADPSQGVTLVHAGTGASIPVFMSRTSQGDSFDFFAVEHASYVPIRTLADGNYVLNVPRNSIYHIQSGIPLTQDIQIGFSSGLFRLFGDLNGNATIDESELDRFNSAYQTSQGDIDYLPELDEQLDGFIGDDDQSLFRKISLDSAPVAENSVVGTIVGSLAAFSLLGPITSYEVLSVDGSSTNLPFVVQNNQIVVAASLDFETNRVHQVRLRALNESGIGTVGQVEIHVSNVNENSSSPIQLTDDSVLENAIGTVGSLFAADSLQVWGFNLIAGAGDYDNAAFSIDGDQLNLLELPDYELRDNYSIRVEAISGTDRIETTLTIDITPVDEFLPEGFVFSTEQFGEQVFPFLIENSPVGQPATRIRVIDLDRGESYAISGYFGDLAVVEGGAFVPIREINFETESTLGMFHSVTATSSNGQSITRSGGTLVIVDVNDAPTVLNGLPNIVMDPGTAEQFYVPADTFFDEDSWDQLSLSASLANGPLPTWIDFYPEGGQFTAEPRIYHSGTYEIVVTATDLSGVSVSTTFVIEVRGYSLLELPGTSADDLFRLVRSNEFENTWDVIRNGQTLFSGNLDNRRVDIVGNGGNDRVIIQGSNQSNTIELVEGGLWFERTIVTMHDVDQLEIRGGGGDDSLIVSSLSGVVNAIRSIPRILSFQGDNGQDSIDSLLFYTLWNVTGVNRGSMIDERADDSVTLNFVSVESLHGGNGDDTFEVEAGGRISGGLFAGQGYDVLRTRQSNARLNIESFSPFTGDLNGMQVEHFSLIESLDNSRGTVTGPTAAEESATSWTATLGPKAVQVSNPFLEGGEPVDLYGFLKLIGQDGDDYFVTDDPSGDWEIDGGGGRDSLFQGLFLDPETGAILPNDVNLKAKTATGLSRFDDIEVFYGNSQTSVIGPNDNVTWTFNDHYVTATRSQKADLTLINMASIIAGNGRDDFNLSTDIVPFGYAFPSQIDAGGGQDTIRSVRDLDSDYGFEWVITGNGIGSAAGAAFRSVENLVGGAVQDTFQVVDASNSSIWFDSLGKSPTSGAVYVHYTGANDVTVNFQNHTATAFAQWSDVDGFFGGFGNDLLIGANRDTEWVVSLTDFHVRNNETVAYAFETIQAGPGNDTFSVNGEVQEALGSSRLIGGAGIDTLSFSNVTSPVVLSLLAGFASLLPNGFSQFENVIGSVYDDFLEGDNGDNVLLGLAGNDSIYGLGGNDVLLGGSGNDTLYGGAGRDMIVGGSDSDWIYGGSGEDLIIAGLSNLLNDESELTIRTVAIDAVMNEWTSNRSYSQRITRLRNGVGLRSVFAINSSTVQSDNAVNRVFGEADDDWFWLGTVDIASDRQSRERVN